MCDAWCSTDHISSACMWLTSLDCFTLYMRMKRNLPFREKIKSLWHSTQVILHSTVHIFFMIPHAENWKQRRKISLNWDISSQVRIDPWTRWKEGIRFIVIQATAMCSHELVYPWVQNTATLCWPVGSHASNKTLTTSTSFCQLVWASRQCVSTLPSGVSRKQATGNIAMAC